MFAMIVYCFTEFKGSLRDMEDLCQYDLIKKNYFVKFLWYKIKKTADSIKTIRKDNTEEISKKVRKILNTKIFQRRIINAFPKLKILPRRKR